VVDRKFQKGDYVRKTKGSWWEGYVRGFYDTEDNEDGICVQLDKPRGPVQLYPAAAFELAEPARSDLHDLLEEALSVLDGYADPTGYTDNYGEQLPADAVQHQGLLAKATVEKIRAALAKPPKHNMTGSDEMLGLAVAAVLAADTEFRSQLPKGWDGDPLSDELDVLRRAFEGKPAPQDHMAAGDLRERIFAAIYDPGATEGYKGNRTVTEWKTDAVMRALAEKERSNA